MSPCAATTTRSASSVRWPEAPETATRGWGMPRVTPASMAPPENDRVPHIARGARVDRAQSRPARGERTHAGRRGRVRPPSRRSSRAAPPRTSTPPLSVSVRRPTVHAASCTWIRPSSNITRAGFGWRSVTPAMVVSDWVIVAVPSQRVDRRRRRLEIESARLSCPCTCAIPAAPSHGSSAFSVSEATPALRLNWSGAPPGPVNCSGSHSESIASGSRPCAVIAAPDHVARASTSSIAS